MKGKSNYFLQFIVIFSLLCLILFPVFFIMALVLDEKMKFIDYFLLALCYINLPLIIFVFFSLFNCIIVLLSKPKIYFYENEFNYKNNIYKYEDIVELEVDFGTISKINGKPHSLVLCRKSEEGLIINNPSLSMILYFMNKCKNKKVYYVNFKEILFYGLISLFISICYLIFFLYKH